jgi:hypothetical protein
MTTPACEEIEDIDKALKRLAALRLRCCFAKSGIGQSDGIKCWCYARDENGAEVVISCCDRILVSNANAIGAARFSVKESS